MRVLDKNIVVKLSKVLKNEKTVGTIKKDISLLANKFPNCTPNARAQIYALQNGTTVRRFLDKEDKASLPSSIISTTSEKRASTAKRTRKHERIIPFVRYPTSDLFRVAHISEANRAYTYKCYTSALILCRKIIENIIADILRAKFPPNRRENKELYYDTIRGRIRDFKELLVSLDSKKTAFEIDKKLVERVLTCVKPFKEEADQKVHSWYHIVRTRAEIDSMDIENILGLLHALEQKVSVS